MNTGFFISARLIFFRNLILSYRRKGVERKITDEIKIAFGIKNGCIKKLFCHKIFNQARKLVPNAECDAKEKYFFVLYFTEKNFSKLRNNERAINVFYCALLQEPVYLL